MKVINLTHGFYPFNAEEVEHKRLFFKGGEPHIKIVPESVQGVDKVLITTRIESGDDLTMLAITVDALKRLGVQHLELFVPYFPAGRQDRVVNVGESLSLSVFAGFINSMGFDKVVTLDCHSEETVNMVDNCENLDSIDFVFEAMQLLSEITTSVTNEFLIACPDEGAVSRVNAITEALGASVDEDVLYCTKARDKDTGKLLGFNVPDIQLNGEDVIIFDDICDGGGTFLGLADKLKEIGAIYGDSITLDRADEICKRLEAKGFATTNVVLGIGSFTYQYNTRDTFGFAMKSTYCEVNGKGIEIFKDPVTDDGTKKSAKGLLHVGDFRGSSPVSNYILSDQVTWDSEEVGSLQVIYKDGEFQNLTTLTEIREELNKQL